MRNCRQRAKYLIADFLSASVAWALFNVLRYYEVAAYIGFGSLGFYLNYPKVWAVQLCVPFFWLLLYYFSGYYNKPFGKSRLSEFFSTFLCVLLGTTLLFFLVLLNDLPRSFEVYYQLYFALLGLQFVLTYLPRLCITLRGLSLSKREGWALKVLIIGTGPRAEKIADSLSGLGYRILGFVNENKVEETTIPSEKCLGTTADLPRLVPERQADEIIVATEVEGNDQRLRLLYSLYRYKCPIKLLADQSGLFSKVRLKTILGLPLVDVSDNNFSEMEKNIKLWGDKLAAAFALLLLSPLFAYISYKVKRGSPGPVLFKQERLGYGGRPFLMYKFRTMYVGSEEDEPLLAKADDKRITPFGRLMRKYRLDELPQFWNVLRGDMSLVGPRPERRYFIEQIVKKAPYYYLLHNVRPGITSLGMVKYGYASSVDEMVERLEYDMLYYENMSLLLDLTILAYTVRTVVTGKGI
ncbi:MAG: sugar transferase [Tannerella sp.]|jgi:exopolysaccharide biosynthesis polyprenyl glycosylphosphotransferase|nr:sugar transferase [Tannerella sp.]